MMNSYIRIISNVSAMMLCALLLMACKPTVPDEYIQPDDLEDILYDYYISQALGGQVSEANSTSFNKNLYYHAVLKKHGVTEALFDSSLVYYYAHSEQLYKIYKNVGDRMENDALGLGASVGEMGKYSKLTANGDTADIWKDNTSAILMPVSPYDKVTFEIKSDSTFRRGDYFLLNFMTTFFYQSGTKDAVVYVAIRYDNDSISTHLTHITVSGQSQLRIQGNQDNDIKDIKGFIYLNRGNDESKTQKIMFVDGIHFVKFHERRTDATYSVKNDTLKSKSDTVMNREKGQTKAMLPGSKGKKILIKRNENEKN